jgi:hypothetical protein
MAPLVPGVLGLHQHILDHAVRFPDQSPDARQCRVVVAQGATQTTRSASRSPASARAPEREAPTAPRPPRVLSDQPWQRSAIGARAAANRAYAAAAASVDTRPRNHGAREPKSAGAAVPASARIGRRLGLSRQDLGDDVDPGDAEHRQDQAAFEEAHQTVSLAARISKAQGSRRFCRTRH